MTVPPEVSGMPFVRAMTSIADDILSRMKGVPDADPERRRRRQAQG
jgi:hypothetical protein